MLFWIFAGLAVFLINIYLPAALYLPTEGFKRHIGPRDEMPEPGIMANRARRALKNYQENIPFFLTFGILALIIEDANMQYAIWGAQAFVISRFFYTLFYLYPISLMRSTMFTIGFLGMMLMAYALI